MDEMYECFHCERPVCFKWQDANSSGTWIRPKCCTEKLLCTECIGHHQLCSCVLCGKEVLCVDDVYTYGQTFCMECSREVTNDTSCISCGNKL